MGFRWASRKELEELLKTMIRGPIQEVKYPITRGNTEQLMREMEAYGSAAGYHLDESVIEGTKGECYLRVRFYRYLDPLDAEYDDLTKQL